MGRILDSFKNFGNFSDNPVRFAVVAEGGELAIDCGEAPDLIRHPVYGDRRWGDSLPAEAASRAPGDTAALGALIAGKEIQSS